MDVLVTGGSGLLGSQLTKALVRAGHRVRLLTRHASGQNPLFTAIPGDLATGAGLAEAVRDVDAIVHAASDPRHAQALDVDGTRRLLMAARSANVAHLIYVSIVGVDRIPVAYYRAKREAERLVQTSDVPWTIVRATQFHPFIVQLLAGLARVPFVTPLPAGFVAQPVDVGDVAARLVRALAAGPLQRIVEYGGPEVIALDELARSWLAAEGRSTRVVSIPVPGAAAAAFRAEFNTALKSTSDGERGAVRWHDWLARQGQPAGSRRPAVHLPVAGA